MVNRADAAQDEFTSQGPNLTALLLSEVLSVRCKLAALDINVRPASCAVFPN